MTNPEDPRTPQERAYDPAEQQAPDETVQWARPADGPTQQLGPVGTPAPEQPTEQYYTADPYQAYGAQAPRRRRRTRRRRIGVRPALRPAGRAAERDTGVSDLLRRRWLPAGRLPAARTATHR